MLISIVIGLVGSILLAQAGFYTKSKIYSGFNDLDDGDGSIWFLWWGRFLQGIWSGGITILNQGYVAEVLTKEHNVKMVNDINIASVLGLPLGPFVGVLGYWISFLHITVR